MDRTDADDRTEYHPEQYWSDVAAEIRRRGQPSVVAGDNNPIFQYKREKFLRLFLDSIDFHSKSVLEVGPGPGGNLLRVIDGGAKRVVGIDISPEMLSLAAETLREHDAVVELYKTDGQHLPLDDATMDITFTVTVLQHNTNTAMFRALLGEICRVTKDVVVLIEDTGTAPEGAGGSHVMRSVRSYEKECARHGFRLVACQYLGLRASRMVERFTRRFLVSRRHREGEPFGFVPLATMRALLAVSRRLDAVLPDTMDLTKMVFVKEDNAA